MFCRELTIKDKVLKIFTAFFLTNVKCESNNTPNNEIRSPVMEIYLTKLK